MAFAHSQVTPLSLEERKAERKRLRGLWQQQLDDPYATSLDSQNAANELERLGDADTDAEF